MLQHRRVGAIAGKDRVLVGAIAERGFDAEQVDREIAAERQREAELGLDFRRPGSPAKGAGQTGAGDQPAEKSEEANKTEDEEHREFRPEEGA